MRIPVLVLIAFATFAPPALAQHVYWSEEPTDSIKRAALDGSGVVEIVPAAVSENPGALAVDRVGGKLYWTAFRFAPPFAPRVMRSDLDGGNVEQLVAVGSKARPGAVALDPSAEHIYYTDPSDCDFCGAVLRSEMDGTGEVAVLSGADFPFALAVDPAGSLWWSNGSSLIYRAGLDGSGNQAIVAATATSIAVDPAGGKIYWADASLARIRRANLDGSSVEDLVGGGLTLPFGIAVDPVGGKVYWTDRDAGTIQRADLDGTGVETVLSGLSQPVGIAVTGSSPSPGAVESVRLARTPGGSIVLEWAAACDAGDEYGIYRGDLGAGYGSLAPEPGLCAQTGTTAEIDAGNGNELFLVVPHRNGRAGGYGTDSSGERPPPASTCRPQASEYGCAR